MKKTLLVGLLGLSIMIPSQVFASESVTFDKLDVPAGKVDLADLPPEYQKKLSERNKVISSYFDKLMELRAEIFSLENEHIGRNLQEMSSNTLFHLNELKKELEYYENNSLELAGLMEIDSDSEDSSVQPLSTKDQVVVDKPKVYYDNDSKLYVGETNWQWSVKNPDNNNAGNDGIGITNTQETLSIFDSYVNTWDSKGTKYYNIGLHPESSISGYHLEFADSSNGATYRGHRGQSWFFFKFYNGTPTGKSVNFNTTYTHTYSDTKIDSVQIGWGTIAVSLIGSSAWERKNEAAIKF